MKILIINGSPTMGKGMTHQLIANFTKGCVSAGAEVEQIELQRMKLKYCTGCLHCFYAKDHLCIHKDGMAEVHEKILAADYLVLATPVFADGVTGQMKTFMDRFVPLIDVRFELVDGRYRHIKRFETLPKVVLLSVAGFYEMEKIRQPAKYFQINQRPAFKKNIDQLIPPLFLHAGLLPNDRTITQRFTQNQNAWFRKPFHYF